MIIKYLTIAIFLCVTVNTSQDTYTVDPSGCVQ